jgi:hypothetical protein
LGRAQLESFIAKFTPAVAADARAALKRMRRLVPGAVELVYDNYNALAVGFGPSERASEAVLSIAVFPRWVTLCFLQCGPRLKDPKRLLKGSGSRVRNIPLASAADLDSAPIRAHRRGTRSRDRSHQSLRPPRLVIKSISAKQRARRPS